MIATHVLERLLRTDPEVRELVAAIRREATVVRLAQFEERYVKRLQRIRNFMVFGLKIFAKANQNYAPIAEAMAQYLSGRGGTRRVGIEAIPEEMRRQMVRNLLKSYDHEGEFIDSIGADPPPTGRAIWGYVDYTETERREGRPQTHDQDQFSLDNVPANPLRYVLGAFIYDLTPTVTPDGGLSVHIHAEDTYDFASRGEDSNANTKYHLSKLGLSDMILNQVKKIINWAGQGVVEFDDLAQTVTVRDAVFSEMAQAGLAAPFVSVVDGTLVELPPDDIQPRASLALWASDGDLGRDLGPALDDSIIEAAVARDPDAAGRLVDVLALAQNSRVSPRWIVRALENADDERNLLTALQYTLKRTDAADYLEAVLPAVAKINWRVASQFVTDVFRGYGFSPLKKHVEAVLERHPEMDPDWQAQSETAPILDEYGDVVPDEDFDDEPVVQTAGRRLHRLAARIPAFRGVGPRGLKEPRTSADGVHGPGYYMYDHPLDARSYASPGGGVLVGLTDDRHRVPGDETIVLVPDLDELEIVGHVPTEHTLDPEELMEEIRKLGVDPGERFRRLSQTNSLFGDDETPGPPGTPCPDCGTRLVPKLGKKPTLECPNCRGRHMANQDGTPRGIPAPKATRLLRQRLHAIMERMKVENPQLTNAMLYRLLNRLVGRQFGKSHIGQMDAAECQAAIDALTEYRRKTNAPKPELVDFSHMPQPDPEAGRSRLQQVQANNAEFQRLGESMTWQQRAALDDLNERLLHSLDPSEAELLQNTIDRCLTTLEPQGGCQ